MRYSLLAFVLLLAGCSGANRPTPSQCEATYAAAVAACDVALTKPDDIARCHARCGDGVPYVIARCHAASVAIRLACLIAAEPPATNHAGKTAAKAGNSKADRWAMAYPALIAGTMTPEAFEAFVLGGTDGPR